MSKLKAVAVMLLLLIGLIAAGQIYLKKSTVEMVSSAENMQVSFRQSGDSAATRRNMKRFLVLWAKNRPFFSMIVSHREIDTVNASSARLPAYLSHDEPGEFDAECDLLIMQLGHLRDVERISWENIL